MVPPAYFGAEVYTVSVSLSNNFWLHARGITLGDGGGITWSFNPQTNTLTANGSGAGARGANPSAKVGLAAVNGSAPTFLRSDGAPPIDQAIAPTWTEVHTFNAAPVVKGITWAAPALLNSWVNYGIGYNPAGYYKDPTGRVHLRGLVKSGTAANAVIFTLPSGYLPPNLCIFSGSSNDAWCEVRVDTSGNVFAQAGGSTTWISLDGVSFTTF